MSGQDIAGLMRVWTTRMGYPYLTVSTILGVHVHDDIAVWCDKNQHTLQPSIPPHSKTQRSIPHIHLSKSPYPSYFRAPLKITNRLLFPCTVGQI